MVMGPGLQTCPLELGGRLGLGQANFNGSQRVHETEKQKGRNKGPESERHTEKVVADDTLPFLTRLEHPYYTSFLCSLPLSFQ